MVKIKDANEHEINYPHSSSQKYSWLIWVYLNYSPIVCHAMSDRANTRTDGKWIWMEAHADLYKNGDYLLPKEFIKDARKSIIPYPFWFAVKNFICRQKLVDDIFSSINDLDNT